MIINALFVVKTHGSRTVINGSVTAAVLLGTI